MVRNAPMSQMNYTKKRKERKTRQLRQANRNMRIATVLYLATNQALYLNVAVYCALRRRRIKAELTELGRPFSFRNIFPVYRRLDFSSFPEPQFRDKFRLPKPLCQKIYNYLTRFRGVGAGVTVFYGQLQTRYVFTLEELILIYLRRLALPDRLIDVAELFGRCPAEICQGSSYVCNELNTIAHEFLDGRPTPWWTEGTARYNAGLVDDMEVPLRDVCMFLDGTHVEIANPWLAHIQRLFYSGYIKAPSNKFVAAVCPQGLFVIVAGPAQGRRHDNNVAVRSNLYQKLMNKTRYPNFQGKVYADSAFTRQAPVYTAYNPSNTDRKQQFNSDMASKRITIEWGFTIVRSIWPSNNLVSRQKILQGIRKNAPGRNFYNSIWLTNLHSCHARGNEISDYFGAALPSLEEYLGVPAGTLD